MGTAHTLILPYSYVFLPPLSTSARARAFSFVRTLIVLFIYSIDRVHLDCMDLIYSLYSWWGGFQSSSFATLPLGFNCGFISTVCRSSTGVGGPYMEVAQLLGLWGPWQHQVHRGAGGHRSRI